MALSDKLFAVAHHGKDFARRPYIFDAPESVGIPPERAREYRRLMTSSDVHRVDVTEDGEVLISTASWGMANRGWRVSTSWRENPPEDVLPSLDAFRKSSQDWEIGYALADKNWYFRIVW